MNFFSFTFIVFLFLVILVYWTISQFKGKYTAHLQNLVILVASLIFLVFIQLKFAVVPLAYACFVYLLQRFINYRVRKNLAKRLTFAQSNCKHLFGNLAVKFKFITNTELLSFQTITKEINDNSSLLPVTDNKELQDILSAIAKIKIQLEKSPNSKEWVNYQRLIGIQLLKYYSVLYCLASIKVKSSEDLQYYKLLVQHFNYAEQLYQDISKLEISNLYNKRIENLQEQVKLNKVEQENNTSSLPNTKEFIKVVKFNTFNSFVFSLIITSSLLPLVYFKYSDFIYESISNFAHDLGFNNLGFIINVLPILGISYFTFNSISLLVAVKRGEIKAISLLKCLTFVTYFPTILAGPLNRATHLIPYLSEVRKPQPVNEIFFYLTLGISKKWLLSATFAAYFVQPIFGSPSSYNSIELILGTYAYAFQLYFDFSGYTDLMFAIGLCFGIRHIANFNNPYTAVNIKDFWNSWHISLSSWIRDYIYIPLGGNKHGFMLAQCYTLIAMLLSGIWHGITINFILWCLLHAFAIIGLNLLNGLSHFRLSKYLPFVSRFITFNFVCFTWIFFNADDFDAAILFLTSFLNNWQYPLAINTGIISLTLFFIYWCSLPLISKLINNLKNIALKSYWLLTILCCTLVMLICINFAPSGIPPFIYSSF